MLFPLQSKRIHGISCSSFGTLCLCRLIPYWCSVGVIICHFLRYLPLSSRTLHCLSDIISIPADGMITYALTCCVMLCSASVLFCVLLVTCLYVQDEQGIHRASWLSLNSQTGLDYVKCMSLFLRGGNSNVLRPILSVQRSFPSKIRPFLFCSEYTFKNCVHFAPRTAVSVDFSYILKSTIGRI